MEKLDFLAILQLLAERKIEFIVVGGISAALHGAPVFTLDLDVVHSRTPENIKRLLAALEELEAHYREPAASTLRPNQSHLESSGHQLLMTKFGPLDLLGTIGAGLDYQALLNESSDLEIGHGLKVKVLSLAATIKIKETLKSEKDLAVLPSLRNTLAEKRKRGR